MTSKRWLKIDLHSFDRSIRLAEQLRVQLLKVAFVYEKNWTFHLSFYRLLFLAHGIHAIPGWLRGIRIRLTRYSFRCFLFLIPRFGQKSQTSWLKITAKWFKEYSVRLLRLLCRRRWRRGQVGPSQRFGRRWSCPRLGRFRFLCSWCEGYRFWWVISTNKKRKAHRDRGDSVPVAIPSIGKLLVDVSPVCNF